MFNNYEISLIKRYDSRRYFENVLQSYYSKNYRAAILLLYNLTIDDLYYKLILMNNRRYCNLNQDLQTIDELSKNSSKYSEVEEKIYKIYKERNILNHDTIDALEFFKKVRNKCAHPSFFKDENYAPKEEEVYMIIKRVYEDILTVDVFIKDPYELMKDDIESKDWGNIIDVLAGYTNHEDNYKVFYDYFVYKYYDKLTDNNFIKLFNTLIKLIILKKGEWEILNQYKNMLLMESMINYLKNKGKIEILYNKYNWSNISEEYLYDDNDLEVYNREWFALTNMYKILKAVPTFIIEINAQNHIVYEYLNNILLQKEEYIYKYWNIFYDDFDDILEKIYVNGIDNVYFYNNIINNVNILTIEQIKKILEKMFKCVPEFNGFDSADIVCKTLINVVRENNLVNSDIQNILNIMNENEQIYSSLRSNSKMQIRSLYKLGIKLDKFINLKKLIES